jgi:DNA polymerase III epsilon subunit-like protein
VRTAAGGIITKAEWSCRISPRHPERITPIAQKVNGFSEHEWRDASSSNMGLWEKITNMVEGCVPICHNPSFDREFVTLAAHQAGVSDLKFDYHWIGTESLVWPLYLSGTIREYSLRGLCAHFGMPEEPLPHTAIEGARACRMVYCSLLKLRSG